MGVPAIEAHINEEFRHALFTDPILTLTARDVVDKATSLNRVSYRILNWGGNMVVAG